MIRQRSLRAAILFVPFLFAFRVFAQNAPPADLDAYVARAMKTYEVPRIAVAIIKDGKLVLAKGYGVRKLGEPAPVDENTVFAIGSNTKAFTAAALRLWSTKEKFRGTTRCTSD